MLQLDLLIDRKGQGWGDHFVRICSGDIIDQMSYQKQETRYTLMLIGTECKLNILTEDLFQSQLLN